MAKNDPTPEKTANKAIQGTEKQKPEQDTQKRQVFTVDPNKNCAIVCEDEILHVGPGLIEITIVSK